jgi:hypothetical protein
VAMRSRCTVVAAMAVALVVAHRAPAWAQVQEGTEWSVTPLRRAGQPVIPLFDGWYPNQDGSYNLCFGYYNLNTEEVIDVPLGPDNFIEPKQFDGVQPTHFRLSSDSLGYIRHWCVFSINVPASFGGRWDAPRILQKGEPGVIWWTLRVNGKEISVPGHLGALRYQLDEKVAEGRKNYAPIMRIEPNGPEGFGRNGMTTEVMRARVGQPLALTVTLKPQPNDPIAPEKEVWRVGWDMHQGPGKVTFNKQEIDLKEGNRTATTEATFDKAGDYLLRVQAIDAPGSWEFHCCWTNGFVKVSVSP